MAQTKYMTIQEFSNITGVSKHTLYHYDDIQLFSPELITENKYRYYSIDQIETIQTIIILKDLGMSLKEIKAFLDSRSRENLIDILEDRENDIDKQIQHLKKVKKFITTKKENIKNSFNLDFSKVYIKEYPTRYYIIAYTNNNSEKEFIQATNDLIKQTKELDYTLSYFQYKKDIESNIYDNYQNVVVLFPDKVKSKNLKTLPSGKYVVAYHIGHWQTIGNTYQRMMKYIQEKHLEVEDPFIEYFIIDNLMTKHINKYVTEISIKIKSHID